MRKILFIIAFFCISIVGFSQKEISLAQVTQHVGDSVIVLGKVADARYFSEGKNAPTLLNIGAAFPNQQLTVVIYGDDRKNFTQAPETYFKDKMVVITGKVELYKGKPQIVVKNADGIGILEAAGN